MISTGHAPHDVEYRQLRARPMPGPGRGGAGRAAAAGAARTPSWLVGEGMALGMIDTIPPRGHHAEAADRLRDDGGYELTVGTAEFGNGTTTVHAQIAATVLGTTVGRVSASGSPTPIMSATTPAPSAAPARWWRGWRPSARPSRCATQISAFAADAGRRRPRRCGAAGRRRRRRRRRIGLAALAAPPRPRGASLPRPAASDGTPRSVAFNVQGFRVAVHRRTGEIRILHSVQAADAGAVINPMQCRGQVEGGVAQALGAALYEEADRSRRTDGSQTRRSAAITSRPSPTCRAPRCFSPTPPTGSVRSARSR